MYDLTVFASLLSILAYLLSIAIGYGLITRFLGATAPVGLRFFLSPGLGLAFTTAVLFIQLCLWGRLSTPIVFATHAVFFIFLLRDICKFPRIDIKITGMFIAVLATGTALLFFRMAKSPFGTGLDVWAMWKLKARFIFYGNWRSIFSPVIDFNCPDYPFFYPLALCWGWLVAGRETLVSSWMIAVAFTLSTVGLLMHRFLKYGMKASAIAGLFLLSTPHFVGMGSSQYADILLAYFNLAVIVLLDCALVEKKPRFAFTAGLFLGIACFVKNEGFLFLVAVFMAIVLLLLSSKSFRQKRPRVFLAVCAGLLPTLSLVLLFKVVASVPNDKVSLHYVAEAIRMGHYGEKITTILRYAAKELMEENSWVYAWVFFLTIFIFYSKNFWNEKKLWILLTLFFLESGYLAVYMVSPLDIELNLRTSLNRVLIHSFPVWTYLFFHVFFQRTRWACAEPS